MTSLLPAIGLSQRAAAALARAKLPKSAIMQASLVELPRNPNNAAATSAAQGQSQLEEVRIKLKLCP